MPSFDELKPFIVLGFALGGVYAMSGVGLVVLYRATGVLNLAYGAIGCAGALLTWELLDNDLGPQWLAYLACVAFGGVVTLAYGLLLGPAFAPTRPIGEGDGHVGSVADPRRLDAVALRADRPRVHVADDQVELPGG